MIESVLPKRYKSFIPQSSFNPCTYTSSSKPTRCVKSQQAFPVASEV